MNINNLPEQVQSGKVRLPRDRYGMRVIGAEFGKSFQKQTPKLTLTCELCTPDTIKYGKTTVKVAGLKATKTFWLTDKAVQRLVDFHNLLGLSNDDIPMEDEAALKEYANRYLGHGINAIVTSKERAEQKEVIAEDGETITREDMLDDNGQRIISYSYEVDDVMSVNLNLKVDAAY